VSRLTGGTLAVIMAGGRGERLKDLTANRCKPATPFGGKFRIIDFVLSNCVNSGIRQISILTQYKAQSLIAHAQRGWSYLRGEFGEFVEVVPAQQQRGPDWYRGHGRRGLPEHRAHPLAPAEARAGARRRSHLQDGLWPDDRLSRGERRGRHDGRGRSAASESRHFGVLTATEWNRVTQFAEKPEVPDTLPGKPDAILASMGIYVFNTRLLEMLLREDAANEASSHDFGKDILPKAIAGTLQVFAYPFQDVKTRAQSYWRDVGTLDAYFEANRELVHVEPELNIYDADWPIWTYQVHQPPAKFVLDEDGRRGLAINSMVSA
ncbi:1-phosphate adenylyltransferase, partial [mine drainage metagenome]